MHVFLYEWITGGGLVEEPGRLPESLLAEGAAMITALAADFVRIPGCRVSVLRDMRLDRLPLPGCDVVDVHSSLDWREEFDRLAAKADWSLAIAPEFDHLLQKTVERIADAGGRSLNCSSDFIAIAADKHRTIERLQRTGVAVPNGRLMEEDEPKLPVDFPYPAVLKPIDGAGSQNMLLVGSAGDEPPPYAWRRRLEQFIPGRPASVAAIGGPTGIQCLPACWQHLSQDGRFAYRGGALIREAELADRATALTSRAIAALPAANGFVGVDMVLGAALDGSEDAVIEINPRLTTSYVGLRQAVDQNLAVAIISAVEGRPLAIEVNNPAMEFSADGGVWTARE